LSANFLNLQDLVLVTFYILFTFLFFTFNVYMCVCMYARTRAKREREREKERNYLIFNTESVKGFLKITDLIC